MRLRHAAAACLLLLTVLAQASAQMAGPAYTFVEVSGPTAAQPAGATVTFNFTAERTCTNMVEYLPPTLAKVEFKVDEGNLTVAGPGQVEFPEQFCAQEPRTMIRFPASIAIPADAAPKVHKAMAVLHPEPAGLVPRYASDASVDFLLAVAAPPEPEAAGEADARASPGAPPLLLLGALALAGLASRRWA